MTIQKLSQLSPANLALKTSKSVHSIPELPSEVLNVLAQNDEKLIFTFLRLGAAYFDLTPSESLIMIEIIQKTNYRKDKGNDLYGKVCFSSFQHIGEVVNLSPSTVAKWVKSLAEKGLITLIKKPASVANDGYYLDITPMVVALYSKPADVTVTTPPEPPELSPVELKQLVPALTTATPPVLVAGAKYSSKEEFERAQEAFVQKQRLLLLGKPKALNQAELETKYSLGVL